MHLIQEEYYAHSLSPYFFFSFRKNLSSWKEKFLKPFFFFFNFRLKCLFFFIKLLYIEKNWFFFSFRNMQSVLIYFHLNYHHYFQIVQVLLYLPLPPAPHQKTPPTFGERNTVWLYLWCYHCLAQSILMIYTLMKSRVILQTAGFLQQWRLGEGWNYEEFSKTHWINMVWVFNLWKARQEEREYLTHTLLLLFNICTLGNELVFDKHLTKDVPLNSECRSFLSHFFGYPKDPMMCRCAFAWQGWADWQCHQHPETRFSLTCSK